MSEPDANFLPGLALSQRFYEEAVSPVLADHFPELRYAAARLGQGSEVLGYDTPRSTDHDWGPRLQLFIAAADFQAEHERIHERLRQQLPRRFLGYSTHFGPEDDEGTRLLADTDGPIDHRVEIWTLQTFFETYMAYDPQKEPSSLEWLTWPQQHLLGVTAGAVYRDDTGELNAVRRRLTYYPRDVWLYLLAAQWSRIGQEEHFVGRAGEVGDEVGSRLLAARLVQDIMQLCFLMEKTYAPYPKWFGTAFARLNCADALLPTLSRILAAGDWLERETYLSEAYEKMARLHNALGITDPLEPTVRYFYNRPFRIIDAGRFAEAIKRAIRDPDIAAITVDIGGIDQFSHSTDLRSDPQLHKRLQSLYK